MLHESQISYSYVWRLVVHPTFLCMFRLFVSVSIFIECPPLDASISPTYQKTRPVPYKTPSAPNCTQNVAARACAAHVLSMLFERIWCRNRKWLCIWRLALLERLTDKQWGSGKISPVDVATMWSHRPYYRSVVNTLTVGLPYIRVYSRHVAGGEIPPEILNSPRKSARANFQSRIKMSKILAFHGCCCNWRSIIRS